MGYGIQQKHVFFLKSWTFRVKSTIHKFQAGVQNLVQGFNILHGYYPRIQDFRQQNQQIQRDGRFSKGRPFRVANRGR